MNAIMTYRRTAAPLAGMVAATLLLAACAGTPETPSGAVQARQELTKLQSDPKLGSLAPDAIRDAEIAVSAAERPDRAADVTAHRVYIAQRKVQVARALAEARLAESQRAAIVAERDKAQLEARTAEADSAHQKAAELQREIDAMHAQSTDRGVVLTLGDVLFETGKADLKAGTIADLTQLVTFLNKYPERTVTIEGHTDSVGSEDFNLGLSQRRAESVRSYLMQQGIDGSRITTKGMGESVPVAANDSAGGRQQNRRVEVIVSNSPMAQR
jgi:outer membrane protein OmpA-like peptidoglycan-associated protein